MRVLVTAGGTRAYFDEVRWIGNVATGKFGAAIAQECLRRGAEVVHLHAADTLPLHQHHFDFREPSAEILTKVHQLWLEMQPYWPRYRAVPFLTVDDYGRLVEQLLRAENIDIVFLSAAVNDYAPVAQSGKISSKAETWTVELRRVHKYISLIKTWAPGIFQVGFKLLADASTEELLAVAERAGNEYHSDVTVANDLRSLRAGQHTIHLIRSGQEPETYHEQIAVRLVDRVFSWHNARSM